MMQYETLMIVLAVALVVGILFWLLRSAGATAELNPFFGLTSDRPEAALVYNLTLGPPRRIRLTDRPPQLNGPRIRPGLPLTIQPSTQPLWYEKGWRNAGGRNEYRGNYMAAGRTYRGLIAQPYAGHFEAYIWHPPLTELSRNTHHSACFTNGRGDGQYKVHFSLEPVSLDHAITSIEVVLEEALTGRRF